MGCGSARITLDTPLGVVQRNTQVTALKATSAHTTKLSHFIDASPDTPRPKDNEGTAANEGR
jgi:hypothetical protein